MPNAGAGGAANEHGSLHRNGAAAFLAVHGLVGREIEGRSGAIPTRLHLEAFEDVDDIVVEMSTGGKWYLQCKRSAGIDAALRAAIAQWRQQAYAPGDRIGLVSRTLRGDLRRMQAIVDQLNDEQAPPLSGTQRRSLDVVIGELKAAGCLDPDAMVRDILFLQFATESGSDAQLQIACALLAGIVAPGQSETAFRSLRNLMQESAASRRWTDISDWLGCLEAAGIELRADFDGVPAAATTARRQAIRAYREVISRPLDVLSLSALNPRLGDVHVEDLLAGWEVRWGLARESGDLARVARRNSRFVMTGLPGIGKSEAMCQLAAHMASDLEAPLPVLVDLKGSVSLINSGASLTLDTLLRQVAESVGEIDPAVTAAALRDALFSGNAVLLVDGLDEARRRRGRVATDLRRILEALPFETGFILSTRPSGVDAASQVGLPYVELQSPKSLERSLPEILRALAPTDSALRGPWLDERMQRVHAESRRSDDIWGVPLLATLAAIRIANDVMETANPVELLSGVIDDSVTAWEQLKANHADGLDPAMRPQMLTDGFVTIGCLINGSGATVKAAEEAVREQLAAWDLPVPLTAELARQVVHFWDERVGVFISNGAELSARSRQFAELADARRASQLAYSDKKAWLESALEDADQRQTVRLAVQSDESLRRHLLDCAGRNSNESIRSRAVQWTASFAPTWPDLPLELEGEIVDLLADAAEDHLPPAAPGGSLIERIRSRGEDGDGWHFAMQLARLSPADPLRAHHQARLDGLVLAPPQRDLLTLFTALKSAREEQRSLTEVEVELVAGLLETPAPAGSTTGFRDGTLLLESHERYIEGTADVIAMAVDHVSQLPLGSAERFVEMARRLPASTFDKVTHTLSARGFDVDRSSMFPAMSRLLDVADVLSDRWGLTWLLKLLAEFPTGDLPGTKPEPWRWGELSDLISVIGWNHASMGDIRVMRDMPDELQRIWIESVVSAYGFDRGRLSAEAKAILRQDVDECDALLHQLCTPPLEERNAVRSLSCDEAAALAGCFASPSEEVARQVAYLTANTGCSDVSLAIEALDLPMTWQHLYLATAVSIATAAEPLQLMEKYQSSESPERSAVALIVASSADDYPDLLATLREDRDAAVRFRCGGDVRSAEYWTCSHCLTENTVTQTSCAECHIVCSWMGK